LAVGILKFDFGDMILIYDLFHSHSVDNIDIIILIKQAEQIGK